jgi:hypothetical protein
MYTYIFDRSSEYCSRPGKTNKQQIIEHHNETLGLELCVHDHLQPIINKKFIIFYLNKKQTFSRYCKTASAPARTTNVAPKAIPV